MLLGRTTSTIVKMNTYSLLVIECTQNVRLFVAVYITEKLFKMLAKSCGPRVRAQPKCARANGRVRHHVSCSSARLISETEVKPNVYEAYWEWKGNRIRFQRSGESGEAVVSSQCVVDVAWVHGIDLYMVTV